MKGFAKGFTLIEVAIYTVLSAVIGTLMIGIFLSVSQAYQRESASAEVTGQLTFVTQAMGRLIRDASNIEMATSTATSTLKLRMQDATKDPTCISLVNGTIKLAEGPDQANANNCNSITSDLTNTRVIVDALNFKKTAYYPGHDTVSYDVQMTYKSLSPKAQVQRKLSSAVARVSAATFDSDLVPGSSYNYTIGQYLVPWKNIYMADGSAGSPSYTFSNGNDLGIFKVSGTSTMSFSTQGLERMRIDAGGNVGIGTTGPGRLLELYKSDATAYSTSDFDKSYNLLKFNNPDTTIGSAVGMQFLVGTNREASIQAVATADGTMALTFGTRGGGVRTEKMRIDSTGNVGIGTTSPGSVLSVNGAIYGNSTLAIGNTITSSGAAQILSSTDGGTANRYMRFTTTGSDVIFGAETSAANDLLVGALGYAAIFGNIKNAATQFGTNNNVRMTIAADGNVGIGTTGPGYTLTVNGTAWVTSGAWSGSDIRWKKNIKPLENSLSKILSLQGVNFEWRKKEYPDLKFNDGTQIGFIAQEAEKVLPEVVTTDNNGYKGISYEKIVPVLTEAIKEQQKQIEELKAENKALENRIEVLETK